MRKAPVRENPVRKKGDLRETIRDKAGELFGRVGYGNITVEDIANHLGISKASIYYHFASKEEIYFEFQLLSHEKALEGIMLIFYLSVYPSLSW
jgi:AcrR family transcriptional regulator